ncbi:unnamed protein product [Rhizophagus irregularis]|nr:unnamed protein product [Rhizophagus irregularis]
MDEICEIVPSQKGNDKINVRGYLMIKERNRKNKFYWCCERKKSDCKGRAVTIFTNNFHYLQNFVDHNHAPQASSVQVAKVVAQIKNQAQESSSNPAQIIQNNVTRTSEEIFPYLPTQEALRMRIKRVRKANTPPEPQSLEQINIPNSFCYTFNEELFLVKNIEIRSERILLFTTKANVQHLSQSPFWIMDGTFKTVPRIFYQLYTIHGPVGAEENSRILPLVYVLMSGKSKELYQVLFQNLIEFAEENNISLTPSKILTDFEIAAINASNEEFPGVINKGCLFHLGQSGWRKIQECGLAVQYGSDEHLSLMLRHLFALAFVPSSEIPIAFDTLKSSIPPEANEIVQWFEENYVLGKVRRQLQDGNIIRTPPLFPPQLWSVHDSMESGIPRTQNFIEAWHNRWSNLVGNLHVGVYTIIKELQKEQQKVELQIENILRGAQRPKQKNAIIDRENRITTIFNDRVNRTVMDYLRGIAHNISL